MSELPRTQCRPKRLNYREHREHREKKKFLYGHSELFKPMPGNMLAMNLAIGHP